jgi:hypothetical protein
MSHWRMRKTTNTLSPAKAGLAHMGRQNSLNPPIFNRTEFDPKAIGRYHREMFRLHDLEDWDALKQNAGQMILAMGYSQQEAQECTDFILLAYKAADRAVEARSRGDIDAETIIYNDMQTSFVRASQSLHSESASIKYKMGWYKAARNNKPFLVAYYLFREHLKRFGILHVRVVMYSTWIAFWGGYFAHKKHDWTKLERVMVKYWTSIRRICPIRPPPQI